MLITIANTKGGTKKSTTVLNLASIFAPHYIIDLDVHDSIATFNKIRPEQKQFNIKQFTSKVELATFLIKNKNDHSIIVDCGGFDSELNAVAMKAADLVIVPTTESPFDIRGVIHTNDVLERENIKEAWLVPNGVHHSKKHFRKLSSLVKGMPRMTLRDDLKIQLLEDVNNAAWRGLGINEHNKHCEAARQYKRLGAAIMEYKNQ